MTVTGKPGDDTDATVYVPPASRKAFQRSALQSDATVRAAEERAIDLGAVSGVNPIVATANQLLSLVPQLRASVSHPDQNALRDLLLRQIVAFEKAARERGISAEHVLVARLFFRFALGPPFRLNARLLFSFAFCALLRILPRFFLGVTFCPLLGLNARPLCGFRASLFRTKLGWLLCLGAFPLQLLAARALLGFFALVFFCLALGALLGFLTPAFLGLPLGTILGFALEAFLLLAAGKLFGLTPGPLFRFAPAFLARRRLDRASGSELWLIRSFPVSFCGPFRWRPGRYPTMPAIRTSNWKSLAVRTIPSITGRS